MKTANVIIGSGFGDEGKGLATDFYASQAEAGSLVVRFNGGAQAGHMVLAPDGHRHIFSHTGSGSFSGASTYLSRYFVCQPMSFSEELEQLNRLGLEPEIYVDRESPVTTPFDVMINQTVEAARAGSRHGSCGMGFGETLERQQFEAFRLVAGQLAEPRTLRERLREIRDRYVPRRLAALGLAALPEALIQDEIIERFIEDSWLFTQLVRLSDNRIMQTGARLIFEGAQGLLLDMDRGTFPHVTRSNTGLKNALALAAEAGVDQLNVSYISRWYATRHGVGPMGYERALPPLADFIDRTNQPNPWQGALRFGLLDTDALIDAVRNDLSDAGAMQIKHEWLLSWADKAPRRFAFAAEGKARQGSIEDLAAWLVHATSASGYRLANGETRRQVSELILATSSAVRAVA